MNRRRLDVEAWRDAMLAVSGQLDRTIGGPSFELSDAASRRRTLYAKISRHKLDPLLRLFDFPDPNITSSERPVTTVPLQQLFVLNSEFIVLQAQAIAADLLAGDELNNSQRIERAFLRIYSRLPDAEETALGLRFLEDAPGDESGEPPGLSRWEQYIQALLAANEFLYLD
jgi:hypothetical protein